MTPLTNKMGLREFEWTTLIRAAVSDRVWFTVSNASWFPIRQGSAFLFDLDYEDFKNDRTS